MKSKSIRCLPLILVAILLTACTSSTGRQGEDLHPPYPSQLLTGEVYVLGHGEKIDGNIVGFDTTLIIEDGASVLGDIHLFASESEISGRVTGDLNLFGGITDVSESGVINGSINQIANELDIASGAVVSGEINTFSLGNGNQSDKIEIPENAGDILKPRTWIIFQAVRGFLLLFFSMLIVFLFQDPTTRVSKKLQKEPLVSWIVGLVTLIALPLIALIFIITICLSPVGLILLLGLGLSNLWGWSIICYTFGSQLARWFKLNWSAVTMVALGSLFFGIIFTLTALIPFLGFTLSGIISAFGIGAIILSFLTRK